MRRFEFAGDCPGFSARSTLLRPLSRAAGDAPCRVLRERLRIPARCIQFAAQERLAGTNFAKYRETGRGFLHHAKVATFQRSTLLCRAGSRFGVARCETISCRDHRIRWILFTARPLRIRPTSAAYLLPRELQRLSPSTAGLRTAGPPPAVPIVARPISIRTVHALIPRFRRATRNCAFGVSTERANIIELSISPRFSDDDGYARRKPAARPRT
jgi:hypothetical protein